MSDNRPIITVDAVVNACYVECPDCGRKLKIVISTRKKEPESPEAKPPEEPQARCDD
jgi:hypothetical protein